MRLGSSGQLRTEIAARLVGAKDFVLGRSATDFEADDDDELVETVVGMYSLQPLNIRWDEMDSGHREERIDVSDDYRHATLGRKASVQGLSLLIEIPFDGDRVLLTHSPQRSYDGLEAEIAAGHDAILLHYTTIDLDTQAYERWWEGSRKKVSETAEWANADAEVFNAQLLESVRAHVRARRERLRQQKSFLTKVGLTRRPDAPLIAPLTRRHLTVQKPSPGTASRPSAPSTPSTLMLDGHVVDGVLSTLESMGLAFERSPAAFARLNEEELRNFLLVALNATWQGDAIGEAFNATGHTDILIRSDNQNLFVAELKFYDGPRSVTDAISQLQSYLTHRDSYAALIVFIRGRKDQTAAVRATFEAVEQHPDIVDGSGKPVGVRQEFVMTFAHDQHRKVRLAVLAFVVPTISIGRSSAP